MFDQLGTVLAIYATMIAVAGIAFGAFLMWVWG